MRNIKYVLILAGIVFLFAFSVKSTRAACDPPECGPGSRYGDCREWGPEYQCKAKCCVVPDDGGGGGGGGGGGISCGAGKEKVCEYPYGSVACSYMNQTCSNPDVTQCRTICVNPPGYFTGSYCQNNPDRVLSPSCVLCYCAPICNVGTPAITSITRGLPLSNATVSWSGGTGAVSFTLYMDDSEDDVNANCPSGQGSGSGKCAIVNTNAVSPQNVTNLAFQTVYYAKVVAVEDGSCSANSGIAKHLTSCFLTPMSANLSPFESQVFTTGVNNSPEVDRVAYDVSNPLTTEVNPASDTNGADGYKTSVTALQTGSSVLTSDVYIDGEIVCTDTSTINVTPPGPWWQVVDSDITSMGDLITQVPAGLKFNLPGGGGYPGVPAYSGGTDLTTANVSDTGWLANSSYQSKKIYDYRFFKNQIPTDIQAATTIIPITSVSGSFFESGGTLAKGYYWYKYDGSQTGLDLTISSGMDIGDRRVVLLVDSADLYINGSINLTDGQGFFGVFVGTGTTGGGNIIINPLVGGSPDFDLEGIYFADDSFQTGISSAQLRVRGSVAAYGGVSLQRDLGGEVNPTTPSEVFEYGPDQIVLFPPKLSTYKMKWKEVAP